MDLPQRARISAELIFYYWKNHGFRVLVHKIVERIKGVAYLNRMYAHWIAVNEPGQQELQMLRSAVYAVRPLVSIVVPVYRTQERHLRDMIESVIAQTYSNWELCIAAGGECEPNIDAALSSYAARDARIRIRRMEMNGGIVGNTNAALDLSTGSFIGFMDHDDVLAPFALSEIVKAINSVEGVDVLYSDEDKLEAKRQTRCDPHFKPDWSPDTLRSYNYIGHLFVLSRPLLDAIGLLRKGYEGSQDYDLILRAVEKAKKIHHIPEVLYHWRKHQGSSSGNPLSKEYAYLTAKRALNDHLERTGYTAEVEDGLFLGSYQVHYSIPKSALVSIIIPNCDHVADLKKCIGSIRAKTDYQHYEIIVVENNSLDKATFDYYSELKKHERLDILTWPGVFNYSAVNNFAVQHAKGDVLLLLNNDTEIINAGWLENMLEHALRPEVGAVGAKLYYPNGTIQHAGVIIGLGGVAGHSHQFRSRESFGYVNRPMIVQNMSAVTGACMMMRASVFREAGGFDERFALAFNDVDLCLKIRERGYLIVWTPFTELYHYESRSRGYEITPGKRARFYSEVQLFKEKWAAVLDKGDPYYNPNLSLTKDFALKL